MLPGEGNAARVTSADGWIVAGTPDGTTKRIARRFGARPVAPGLGIYRVSRTRARAFASTLSASGLLRFSEPNVRADRLAFPTDPLSVEQGWLPRIVAAHLDPPPVTPSSPELAIVDDPLDMSHPELAGHVRPRTNEPVSGPHGTQVAAVAGASANGEGITGVWPGMRLYSAGPVKFDCAGTSAALADAVEDGVATINMSYGFEPGTCFSHAVATQYAVARDVVLVAAVGNSYEEGNRPVSPAVDPHVLTVAAVKPGWESADFSNENGAVDLAAPGAGIVTATPKRFDDDGSPDGYTVVDGTSFSSPIAAAAATWLRAVRPGYSSHQIGDLLRNGSVDLGGRGWDERFGYGLVNLEGSLSEPKPRHDPAEPNDDIQWVGDAVFDRPAPLLFKGRGRVRLRASLDGFEDPADVWRIVVAPRSAVRIRLTALAGDPDLDVYSTKARTIYSNRHRVAASSKRGSDGLILRNRARRPQKRYVDAYLPRLAPVGAEYRLDIRRIR